MKRTLFRICRATADQGFAEDRHARVLIGPGRRAYRFYLTDLGRIDRRLVDPRDFKGEKVLHWLMWLTPFPKGLAGHRSRCQVAPLIGVNPWPAKSGA